MIIEGFEIENWTCIKKLTVSGLPPTGVIVLHGPNRTGKSSLVQALRACLMDYSSHQHRIENLLSEGKPAKSPPLPSPSPSEGRRTASGSVSERTRANWPAEPRQGPGGLRLPQQRRRIAGSATWQVATTPARGCASFCGSRRPNSGCPIQRSSMPTFRRSCVASWACCKLRSTTGSSIVSGSAGMSGTAASAR